MLLRQDRAGVWPAVVAVALVDRSAVVGDETGTIPGEWKAP
jgi:hypothetical protein